MKGSLSARYDGESKALDEVLAELHLITAKNVIYCANVDEEGRVRRQ